ncbi:MAG: hypothetical protein AB1486_16045 [Planctomycetota bacterium]
MNTRRKLLFVLSLITMSIAGVEARAQHTTSRTYGSINFMAPVETDLDSDRPVISGDGDWIAFDSIASVLVMGDSNNAQDVFISDLSHPGAFLVSVDSAGNQGNADSFSPDVSEDGNWVAFASNASNLIPGDTNELTDIFLHDIATGLTTRVSVDSAANQANGRSLRPSISDDGRYVAFESVADNLVAGDSNGVADVFVHDCLTGATIRVSVGSTGVQGNGPSVAPSIDGSGDLVAFTSEARNLVPGDGNGVADVFVRDIAMATTRRISESVLGGDANGPSDRPAISHSGSYVSYASAASDIVLLDTNAATDIFLHDLATSSNSRVSLTWAGGEANGDCYGSAVSNSGRVVFSSTATNLVLGDSNACGDIFARDPSAALTVRISVDSAGGEANAASYHPDLSASGCDFAFSSDASNLVGGDSNGARDIFHHRHASFCVTLATAPLIADLGGLLTLSSGGGVPYERLAIFVVALDNVPFFGFPLFAKYDATGFYSVTLIVPGDPAISGHLATFQAFTPCPGCGLNTSNLRYTYFQ